MSKGREILEKLYIQGYSDGDLPEHQIDMSDYVSVALKEFYEALKEKKQRDGYIYWDYVVYLEDIADILGIEED